MYQNRELLLYSLRRFFSSDERVRQIHRVIQGESSISLRLIDWFVTNYSRTNNIIHTKHTADGPVCINFYLSYRSQLKTFSKQQFDPFRRYERLVFEHGGVQFETTVGQLNFFRWAIENDIVDYIDKHRAEIETAMSAVAAAPSALPGAGSAGERVAGKEEDKRGERVAGKEDKRGERVAAKEDKRGERVAGKEDKRGAAATAPAGRGAERAASPSAALPRAAMLHACRTLVTFD